MIRCIDEAKEQVRRETGLSVTDAQVERVLAGQSCSMDENARTIIQKQGRIYTEALLSAAMEAGFDLKAVPAVMLEKVMALAGSEMKRLYAVGSENGGDGDAFVREEREAMDVVLQALDGEHMS